MDAPTFRATPMPFVNAVWNSCMTVERSFMCCIGRTWHPVVKHRMDTVLDSFFRLSTHLNNLLLCSKSRFLVSVSGPNSICCWLKPQKNKVMIGLPFVSPSLIKGLNLMIEPLLNLQILVKSSEISTGKYHERPNERPLAEEGNPIFIFGLLFIKTEDLT